MTDSAATELAWSPVALMGRRRTMNGRREKLSPDMASVTQRAGTGLSTHIRIDFVRLGLLLLVGAAVLTPHGSAYGQEGFKRFELRAGVFFAKKNSDIRVSTDLLAGTTFNSKRDLGIGSSDTTFRVEGVFRFSRHHRLDASWFELSRGATHTLDREFTVRDKIFRINANVKARLNVNIFKFSYSYMFTPSDKFALGPTVGIFFQKEKIRIEETENSLFTSNSLSLPLPVFGIRGKYDFTDRLRLIAFSEFFFISTDKYGGHLYDGKVALEYDLFRYVGIGLAYNRIKLDVDVNKRFVDWSIDMRTSGLLAYAKLAL